MIITQFKMPYGTIIGGINNHEICKKNLWTPPGSEDAGISTLEFSEKINFLSQD
jgi:hypothetical protein